MSKDPITFGPPPEPLPPGSTFTSRKAIASLVLGFLCCVGTIPAIVFGALALADINRSGGRIKGRGMAIAGILLGALGVLFTPALLLPAVQSAREAARRAQCTNNLKQIGLALHNYQATWGSFPAASYPDDEGRPRMSWRVAILPYLEQVSLYNAYNAQVAWDQPENHTVINARVNVFLCPSEIEGPEELMTHYLMVSGPGTFSDPNRDATSSGSITDGAGSTIAVLQAKKSVHWASPEDFEFDATDPSAPLDMEALETRHPGVFQALMADGSVRAIRQTTPPEVVRSLMSIGGNEVLSEGDY